MILTFKYLMADLAKTLNGTPCKICKKKGEICHLHSEKIKISLSNTPIFRPPLCSDPRKAC